MTPWYKPNGRQAIFGVIVGLLAGLTGVVQADKFDGEPLFPFLISIISIAWALGYRRTNAGS